MWLCCCFFPTIHEFIPVNIWWIFRVFRIWCLISHYKRVISLHCFYFYLCLTLFVKVLFFIWIMCWSTLWLSQPITKVLSLFSLLFTYLRYARTICLAITSRESFLFWIISVWWMYAGIGALFTLYSTNLLIVNLNHRKKKRNHPKKKWFRLSLLSQHRTCSI